MFSWFKLKPLLSEEDRQFQLATFRWLLKHFGGQDFFDNTQLVLPTNTFFPVTLGSAEEAAQETFAAVKRHAGLENWPCHLVAQEEDTNARVAPSLLVNNAPTNPLGTFQAHEDNSVTISYNPALTNDPVQLVATFAHELAHYLTATAEEAPPGGWDNWEFATDIAAVFLGFGIFMVNSAFNFRQTSDDQSQGWQSSRNGYLSETEFIYALALFLALQQLPHDAADGYLKPHLRKLLKKAMREIARSGAAEELRGD